MKFEKLNGYNNNKIIFISGFIIAILLIITINLFMTKAKYQVTESVQIVNGKVNYSLADLNVIAMYQQVDNISDNNYEQISSVPKSGYSLNTEKSYCTEPNNEQKLKNNMLYKNGKVSIDITKRGTKCYLYFDEGQSTLTLKYLGLKSNGSLGDTFYGTSCDEKTNAENHNIDGANCSDFNNGIYEIEDDDGISYYYRGTVNNNWVKIGTEYWRIIRINGNGTIRLIYNGINLPNDGRWMSDNDLKGAYNSYVNDNKYVGFMYGIAKSGSWNNETLPGITTSYEQAHENNIKSDILLSLEKWYSNSNLKNYEKYLDNTTGFCNDRTIASKSFEGYGKNAYGKNAVFYAPGGRTDNYNIQKQEVTLKCANKGRDLFTKYEEENENGNGKLIYPIGLITSDEAILAGGFGGVDNYGYWLYSGNAYWTMSPFIVSKNTLYAGVFIINSKGRIGGNSVNVSNTIKPVINLQANILFEKSNEQAEWGTIENPYIVQ